MFSQIGHLKLRNIMAQTTLTTSQSTSSNTSITALNKKHQAKVNKAIYWLSQHNEADRQRNIADSSGNEKNYNAWDKKCQKTFDRYEEYTSELPSREVKQIEKSELY